MLLLVMLPMNHQLLKLHLQQVERILTILGGNYFRLKNVSFLLFPYNVKNKK